VIYSLRSLNPIPTTYVRAEARCGEVARTLQKSSSDGTDCTTWKVQGYLLIVIRVLAGASIRAP
jgi:hypothetical protein